MGCCESKLIGFESASNKYEQGPVCLNQNFELSKKLMINIAPDLNDNASSLQTLRLKLDNAVNQFELDKGPIAFAFSQEIRARSMEVGRQGAKEKPYQHSKKTKGDVSQIINSDFDTDSNVGSQSSQLSDYLQNNTKILSGASLNTRRELEKQLFYINSNQIGSTKLLNWSEEDRLSWQVSQSQMIQILQKPTTDPKIRNSFVSVCCALLLGSFYQATSSINLLAYKKLKQGCGFRVFANGIKRMLKLQSAVASQQLIQQACHKLYSFRDCPLSYWTYVFTGWIPQVINLADFNNNSEIFKRLLKNFNNGNLLIIFSNADSSQLLLVKQIDAKDEMLLVVQVKRCEQIVSQRSMGWGQIASNYPWVHVNWNPLVYNFAKKVEAISVLKNVLAGETVASRTNPKIVLKIPASKSEIEVRVLIQLHQQQTEFDCDLSVSLFQSTGRYLKIEQSAAPIRKCISTNAFFLSEIFIFEKSEESSEYMLALQLATCSPSDIQLTANFYTFGQVDARFMQEPQLVKKQAIQSEYSVSKTGFGMNSPLFDRNLQYSLRTSKGTLCNVKVYAETQNPLTFQICVLPDKLNSKDITLVRPSELVKQVCQSEQFETQGSLQFMATEDNYIITIVSFTPTQGRIRIQVEHYSREKEAYFSSDRVTLTQINLNPQFLKEFPFFWKLTDPGPRKRTKTNSDHIFYPIQTFERFFENPMIDYYLPKGVYQFSIVSKTFASSFNESDLIQKEDEACIGILSGTPPSLSLGIFELNQNREQARIVIDDYQYVPYGIGFWTAAIELEGLYRFVFAKIERGPDEGIFRIRKLNQN